VSHPQNTVRPDTSTPGAHTEAVIVLRLSKMSYSLGSQADCDLILPLERSGIAMRLSIYENEPNVTFQCLDLSNFVNGIVGLKRQSLLPTAV